MTYIRSDDSTGKYVHLCMPVFARNIFLLLGFLAFTCGASAQGNKKFSDEEYNFLYYFQEYQEVEFSEPKLAKIYADSCLYWARKTKKDAMIGMAFQCKGWYEESKSSFKPALDYYYKSLSYMKKANNEQGIADAYGNLANAYYFLGDLTKCLEMQLLSLEYYEKILAGNPTGDKKQEALSGRSIAIHNIGDLYLEIGLFQQADDYLYESMAFDLEYGSEKDLAISYTTLGKMYKAWDRPDSAEFYFQKAIEIEEFEEQLDDYSSALLEYATLRGGGLSQQRRTKMALEALENARFMGKADSEVEALIKISDYFFDQLSTDSLSTMLREAYTILQREDLQDLAPDYFRMYSRYNSRLGDFEQAYFALDNYLELKMVADERRHTQDVIAGGIRYKLQAQFEQDSLQQVNKFATERNAYLEDISEIQNIVYLSVIGFILLIASLIYYVTSNRRKNRMNAVLMERNQLVQAQKDIVEEHNKSISDSINYARRLQSALLPTPQQINKFLPDSFLFFLPKDVVSGDFYWFENQGDWCFLAVADCTGHGVPGAMVSVVCSNALNRSVKEFALKRPKDILDKTRELVLDAFAKSTEEVADGMDISLLAIHIEKKKVIFSGAHNGLWLIREADKMKEVPDEVRTKEGKKHVLLEWKGDKQPIGRFETMKPFQECEIQLEDNDQLYLMSDGYADQFGGPKGKKFKYVALKELLLENADQSMEQQKEQLSNTYYDWIKDNEQIDDVCVLGFRL
ncbi:MAG: SpoIIE family protein phosphatase [bacterium]|nr:SpoIIE family protein phosphatase [bacterium]